MKHIVWQLFRRSLLGIRTLLKSLPLLWQAAPREATALTIALVVQSLVPAGILYITKSIVDAITGGLHAEVIGTLVLAWIVVRGLEVILNPWIAVFQGNLGEKLMGYIGLLVIQKATAFPGLQYFESGPFYDEIEFVSNNAGWRPVNLLWFLFSTMREALTIVGVMLLLASIAWWVPVLLGLATLPQVILYARLQERTYAAVTEGTKDRRAMHYYRTVMTTDMYAKELRIFNLAGFFTTRYVQSLARAFTEVQTLRLNQASWTTVLALGSVAANGYVFYYSLQQTIAGSMSVGSILVFVQSLAIIQSQLTSLAEFGASGLYDNLLYMRRLFRFLELTADLSQPAEPQPVPEPIQHGIRFEGVSFSYPDGREALKDVTLSIKPGEIVAIVGENGAGKSTLIKLLARFYDPTAGQITVDGIALDHLDLTRWRSGIAAVFQDFNHYELTLEENIMLGHMEKRDNAQRVAALSGVKDIAGALGEGYQTMLGKQFGGTELSGGQWQKVALARAIARREQARVLILDEPTAFLDPRSESEVFRRFAEMAAGCTTLLITHRLASVRMAHRVIVFKHGQLVEDGTHETLLAQGGEYAALWNLQAQSYQ